MSRKAVVGFLAAMFYIDVCLATTCIHIPKKELIDNSIWLGPTIVQPVQTRGPYDNDCWGVEDNYCWYWGQDT